MYEKMLDMQIGSSEQLITSNILDQKEAQSISVAIYIAM